MLEELRTASSRLRVALDQYVRICSSVQDVCLQEPTPQNITSEYAEQVERELGLIESYDVKMQLAKKAIKVTRNYAFNIAPINHLPTEILARIFRAARDAESRSIDTITLVCSRWHTITLNSPSLWSKVDFYPSLCRTFYPSLDRAQVHISRSASSLLDVRISAEPNYPGEGYHEPPLVDLCKLAAPRMKSLELDFGGFQPDQIFTNTHPAISGLFSRNRPGRLTKLVTFSEHFGFFSGIYEETAPGALMKLNVDYFQLESVLSSVTVLNCVGLYPSWTSRAYHGLVELRLMSYPGGPDRILEAQLVNILNSSPRLRILETSLQITGRLEQSLNISVSLPELEFLQVDSELYPENNLCYLELVRFLTPGLRPLTFTMQCSGLQLTESSQAQTKAFLARSTITQFHAESVYNPIDFLPSMPHLKALVLSSCSSLSAGRSDSMETCGQPNSTPAIYPRLKICVVLDCLLLLDEFRSIMQQCQPQTLMVYNSKFYRGAGNQELDAEMLLRELSEICPNVKITRDPPRFVEYQDFFLDYTIL